MPVLKERPSQIFELPKLIQGLHLTKCIISKMSPLWAQWQDPLNRFTTCPRHILFPKRKPSLLPFSLIFNHNAMVENQSSNKKPLINLCAVFCRVVELRSVVGEIALIWYNCSTIYAAPGRALIHSFIYILLLVGAPSTVKVSYYSF